MLRIAIQAFLLMPALAASYVLPMLFFATPQAIAEGSWLAAIFNGCAMPGFLALVASVVLPQGNQLGGKLRWLLIIGLLIALAACVSFALIMTQGPDGAAISSAPPVVIFGPLIVAVWNLWRLTR